MSAPSKGSPQTIRSSSPSPQQCEPGYGTALQCGYCTPGFVVTARALLDQDPAPTLDVVKEALSGNICRCGCYAGIARAVLHAAEAIEAGADR